MLEEAEEKSNAREYDVFGIGNTLIDIVIRVEESHLARFGLKKGVMNLLDDVKVHETISFLRERGMRIVPGGATTNTLMGIGALGGKCILCGKIGSGEYAKVYEEIIMKGGIVSRLLRSRMSRTGTVVNLITPDAERTFGVSLGAACELDDKSIVQNDIVSSKCLYFTGYELESVGKVVANSLKIAKKHGVMVAMDLGDAELVSRNRSKIKGMMKSADIVFMNENEAGALTGKEPVTALRDLGGSVATAVLKFGERGSIISHRGGIIRVKPYRIRPVDTTGAGDLYAAGFLYSIISGKSVEEAGRIGSYMGARISEQVGALMEDALKKEIRAYFGQGTRNPA